MTSAGKILVPLVIFFATLVTLLWFTGRWENPEIDGPPLEKKIIWIHREAESGLFPGANADLVQSVFSDGKVISKHRYRTDEYRTRIPRQVNATGTPFIFAGCSFVFGDGLVPQETLSWKFQDISPKTEAFNLGFPGGGLHTLLRYQELYSLKNLTAARPLTYIYVFYHAHLERFFLRKTYLNWANENAPHYEVKSGKVTFTGRLGKRNLEEASKEKNFTDQEIDAFALATAELKSRVLKDTPGATFVIVYHPRTELSEENDERLRAGLQKLGITPIDPRKDYRSLMEREGLSESDLKIPVDGHPNSKSNGMFAHLIRLIFG